MSRSEGLGISLVWFLLQSRRVHADIYQENLMIYVSRVRASRDYQDVVDAIRPRHELRGSARRAY